MQGVSEMYEAISIRIVTVIHLWRFFLNFFLTSKSEFLKLFLEYYLIYKNNHSSRIFFCKIPK